jgi:large subunit ribosomal protein L25
VSSAQPVLKATSRTETGKAVAQLIKAGKIPAVVFGHGLASISISIDAQFGLRAHRPRTRCWPSSRLRTTPVMVTACRSTPDGTCCVVFEIKSGESHGRSADPRHRHFMRCRPWAAPCTPGSRQGRALPEKLPEALEVSIEGLDDFEKAIHLRDLAVPAGVTVLADMDEMVLKVAPPHVAEEPEAPVEIPVGEAEAEEPKSEAEPAQG